MRTFDQEKNARSDEISYPKEAFERESINAEKVLQLCAMTCKVGTWKRENKNNSSVFKRVLISPKNEPGIVGVVVDILSTSRISFVSIRVY